MTPLTSEELENTRAWCALPDIVAGRPMMELVRRMLATIDAQAARNKTLERKCTGLETAGETLRIELHAALDAKEKAEAEAMSWRSKWDIMTHNRNAEQVRCQELQAIVDKLSLDAEHDRFLLAKLVEFGMGDFPPTIEELEAALSATASSGTKEKQ